MRGDHGQNARVVGGVFVDIVVAVALDYAAGERVHSPNNIPRDDRMRDPKNGTRVCAKSDRVVAGNEIAHHDGGCRAARYDAGAGDVDYQKAVVGSLAIDDGDIEQCPSRERARHDDSEIIIVRRDFAEHAIDDHRRDGSGLTKIPSRPLLEAIVFDTEKLLDVRGTIKIPALSKSRMTQFSMARFAPELNWMPFVAILIMECPPSNAE
jgi:hypothetical protein